MSRVIAAFAQFFDGSGDPLSNGYLQFLVSGTNNTDKNTYSDSAQLLPNTNPVQLDAEGRCPNVYGQGIYRIILYDYNTVTKAPGEQIALFDPVSAEAETSSSGSNFAEWDVATNYQVGNIVTRNSYYYKSITANNLGNDPEANQDQWEKIAFISFWNQYQTYNTDDPAIYDGEFYTSIADTNLSNQPDISPAWWNPVGSGTILINWEESGTTFRPNIAGYDLGAPGNEVGSAWVNSLGKFTVTPAADPVGDYEVVNKLYSDGVGFARMRWIGFWTPGTYETFDTVTDDGWTMIATTQTDERPSPQPVGDAEWVRDQFSPPDPVDGSQAAEVLYVGQRYTFVPAFIVRGIRYYLPTSSVGYNVEIWGVYSPGTANQRIKPILPGFDIVAENTGYWSQFTFGSLYVESNTIIDIIMVMRVSTGGISFTHEWDYIRGNGDPLPGDIHHQSGGNVDQIRVHEQDTGLVDRSVELDNIGPGSIFTMVVSDYTWEVLSASKTGDVYTFIVDPGARASNATSDFTFTYFNSTSIPYVYNTDLYISDARILGFLGNEYDPTEPTFISANGYGIDINIQNVISSDDWDVVAIAPENAIGPGNRLVGPLTSFKNKIINGNFDFWDYSTSQTSDGYGSDNQWDNAHSGSTKTHSQQAHTLGQTDVPGNSKYYSRTIVTTGGGVSDFVYKQQKIESVATFAGQTVTLSFYAKADSSKNIATESNQNFGTGGSPSTTVTSIGVTTHTLTSSWAKYTATYTIPSVSGKTLGTDGNDWLGIRFWSDAGSSYNARTNSLGNQSGTFDIARVQVEVGPVETEFEDRPVTIERSLCNRFMFQLGDATYRATFAAGRIVSATTAIVGVLFPDEMRAPPTLQVSSVSAVDVGDGGGSVTSTALSSSTVTTKTSDIVAVTAGLANSGGGTTFRVRSNEWIRFTAEL